MILCPLVTIPSNAVVWVNGLQVVVATAEAEDPNRPGSFTTSIAMGNGMQMVVRGNVDNVLRCLAGDEESAKAYYEIYVEPAMLDQSKKVVVPEKPPLQF